jgi:autotransporter-associated beta strand protein
MADRFRLINSAQPWNSTAYWSATLGGGGGQSVPVNGDTATFPVVGVNSTITFPVSGDYNSPNTFTALNSGAFYWNLNSVTASSGSQGILRFNGPTTVNVQRSAPTARGQIGFSFGTVQLRGTGPLIKTGPGLLNFGGDSLQGDNTYAGGTIVNEGWLRLTFTVDRFFGDDPITFANLGAGTTGIVSGASATRYDIRNKIVAQSSFNINFTDNDYGLTFEGSSVVAGGIALEIDNPGNVTTITTSGNAAGSDPFIIISGALAGATNNTFQKSGNIQLTLSGAGTFAGVVRNAQGTLALTNANALQNAVFEPGAGGTTTFAASSAIGGLTGSGAFALSATAMTIGGGTVPATATYSGALSGNVTLTKRNTGTQTLAGTSTRTSAATNITGGAIQLNAATALYASGATGVTTVSSGAGLWLSGGITTPSGAGITINNQGVSLDGAIRNVAGSNTIGSTITNASNSTIANAVSGTTLTLKALTLGTANGLTLNAGSGATIQMDAAATGTGTSELIIAGAGSTNANATGVLAAAVNRVNGTFNSSNTQSIASAKVLDGVGTITGAGALSMASGSTLQVGNGAGDGTLTVANLTFASGTETFQTYKNGGAVSKVAVVGALTHTGTVQVNASSSSWTSGSTHTFLTYGSRSGAGTFTAGTLTGKTSRQSMQIDAAGLTAQTFTIAGNGNASVAWAGGIAGEWYDGQTTGWSGTGITDFKNGDTVTFDATSSATPTATLTGNVSVASLTMNGAAHTIGGSYTLTNAGALTTAGAFKQTLNVAGTHGAIAIGAGSTLELGNVNALGGTGAITLTGSAAEISFTSGADGLSTTRALTLAPGGAVTQYLETSDDASVTISGTLSGGASGFMAKVGAGLVSLSGTNTSTATVRVGVQGSLAGEGRNVLHMTNLNASAPAMRMAAASIFELSQNFGRTYGSATGGIYVDDTTGAGAGFSARGGGHNITTAINFGTAGVTTQWNGPLYFGSALGTATGKVTMTGTLALTSTSPTQTFHVFNGANTNGSSARINTLSGVGYSGPSTYIKTGPGALYVVSGSKGSFTRTLRVTEGAFEVGPTTTAAVDGIEIPSGATNAVVRHESSTAATNCPAFLPAPAANFTLEAAATLGAFSVSSALDIGSRTVTLSGSGTGNKASESGNGTGKYVKTGTGTWSLSYAYASKAAGFSGGADVDEGTLKVTQKFGLGSGPIVVAAGAKLQFTDTVTDPAIIGSIASLTTTGSTARLIIGA